MANDRHKRNLTRKYTGTMKWLDAEGIGYIVCGEIEVLVTPLSISLDIVKQGDMVSFKVKTRDSNSRREAVVVQRFGTVCHKCSRTGHYIADCPDLDWIKCVKCGLVGHFDYNCDQKFYGWICDVKQSSHTRVSIHDKTENKERFVKRSCNCPNGCWLSLFGGVCRKIKIEANNNVVGSTSNSVCRPFHLYWPHLIESVFQNNRAWDYKVNDFDDDDDEVEELKSIVWVEKEKDVKMLEGDDDCFILDFDPNLENLKNLSLGGNFPVVVDDDVCILAEKGKVACRDYPHSRHLCGNKPFQNTPHASHCNMCYCYICDIPAPCKKWTNVSNERCLNHCDASDDIEFWRTQRDLAKNRK